MGMRPPIHWGLGALVTLTAAAVILCRFSDFRRAGRWREAENDEPPLCLGMRLPDGRFGLACGNRLEELPGRAEATLGLPHSCGRHGVPSETGPGDELVYRMENGCCVMDPPRPLDPAHGLLLGLPVDINRADAAGLAVLPGIGPVRARAIVDHRERRGQFQCPEDIVEVKGVGPKTLERLRPWLRDTGETFRRDCGLPDP